MPIPKPKPSENQSAFINRCMGDATMNVEFPKMNGRQLGEVAEGLACSVAAIAPNCGYKPFIFF